MRYENVYENSTDQLVLGGSFDSGQPTTPFREDLSGSSEARLVLASLQAHVDMTTRSAVAVRSAVAAAMDSSPAISRVIGGVAPLTIPRWHFAMLNDTQRNDAFTAALQRRIRPGAHVLDIGSGTGLLAMMAARAGAGKVVTCEANPLLAEIACQVVAAHGLSEVITVIPKRSSELRVGSDLDSRADLIVCEIVDCGLVGEGLLPTMRHAREHLLAPGGQMVPKSAHLLGFLIESEVVMGLNQVTSAGGFDVRLLNLAATRGHFPVRLGTWPHRRLSDTVELASFDMANDPLEDGHRRVSLPVIADGKAHALVVWFEMDLGADVLLSNPPQNLRSHWMQALVILDRPVRAVAGRNLDLELHWKNERLTAV